MTARSIFPVLRQALAAAACAGAAATAGAAPVSVSVTSFAMSAGSGYGTEAREPGGTLLDVRFSNAAFAVQNFVLTAVNDSFTFDVGTVRFDETSIGGQETDDLGLLAQLTFASPIGLVQSLAGAGVARPGTVANDARTDFSIAWAPLTFSFGNGALLGLALNDVAFTATGILRQTATITLLQAEAPSGVQAVPEPGGLALASLALVLMVGTLAGTRGRTGRR